LRIRLELNHRIVGATQHPISQQSTQKAGPSRGKVAKTLILKNTMFEAIGVRSWAAGVVWPLSTAQEDRADVVIVAMIILLVEDDPASWSHFTPHYHRQDTLSMALKMGRQLSGLCPKIMTC